MATPHAIHCKRMSGAPRAEASLPTLSPPSKSPTSLLDAFHLTAALRELLHAPFHLRRGWLNGSWDAASSLEDTLASLRHKRKYLWQRSKPQAVHVRDELAMLIESDRVLHPLR